MISATEILWRKAFDLQNNLIDFTLPSIEYGSMLFSPIKENVIKVFCLEFD